MKKAHGMPCAFFISGQRSPCISVLVPCRMVADSCGARSEIPRYLHGVPNESGGDRTTLSPFCSAGKHALEYLVPVHQQVLEGCQHMDHDQRRQQNR